jgi:predicted MFS family arabinose efflux permease
VADSYGEPWAFVALATVGLVATILVATLMPETAPAAGPPPSRPQGRG